MAEMVCVSTSKLVGQSLDKNTKLYKTMANPSIERTLRYRVNVSQTSTGKKGFEVTVDGLNYSQEEILERSDAVVAELERRYPPEVKEK